MKLWSWVRQTLLRRLLPLTLAVALFTPWFLFVRAGAVRAAGGVVLDGWGCYSGCSWTDTSITPPTTYTVFDSNYQHNPGIVGDTKNWQSVVDWYGTYTYIYPSNHIDSSVPCTTAGGYAGEQLHGVSSWTNPDGGVQTQTTLGACIATNHSPTVSLSCPSTASAGQTVTCTASASDPDGDPITWSWGGPAGAASSYTFMIWDTTPVSVSVSDGRGGSGSDSKTITVTVTNHAPSVSLSCPATVTLSGGTAPATCTATGADPDAGQTVTVNLAGQTGTGSVTTTLNFMSAGSYSVTASATDNGTPSMSATASTTITVAGGSGPSASVSCSPSSVTADGTSTSTCTASASGGTAPYTYSWGGTTKTVGPWTSATTQTVSVTVTDSKGQTGAGSAVISIGAPGAPPPTSTCSGGQVSDGSGGCTCPVGQQWNGTSCYTPCYPTDGRSASVALTPTAVTLPGGLVQVTLSYSGYVNGTPTASGDWGASSPMTLQSGKYVATLSPYPHMDGKRTVSTSIVLWSYDGCGGTNGPSTFTRTATVTVTTLPSKPGNSDSPTTDDPMTVTNMPLEQYLTVCLGDMEPWYCGIDAKLAAVYIPDLQARSEAYLTTLGEEKWRKLVQRIDKALTDSGQKPSGLAP